MSRVTSRIAYKEINEDGTSSNQKDKIIDLLTNDPYTQDKKGMSLREIAFITRLEINAVSGRVNELKNDRILEECEKRRCTHSKRLITPVRLNK